MRNPTLLLALLLSVLLVSGCLCCCGGPGGGSTADQAEKFINNEPKGDECVSDLSCNGDETCHNGYCV